ncbi:DUF4124 domain-containing protein [Marinobacter sp.]|uniref:DUF4124 domain-containing protein n=1 Tax=Marinobacter sp. TaxID=50741 RepID=UPI00384F562C
MIRWLLLSVLSLLLSPAVAGVYRCETESGVRFSDQPCGPDAQRITVPDNRIGGSFDSNLPEPEPSPEKDSGHDGDEEHAEKDRPCRHINSTRLRRHLVAGEVVQGMTKDQVIRAFGRPPETYPVPQETWVYHTDYYGRLYELTYVYFEDGCVERMEYRKP